jgi:hypothetical protein
MCPYAQQNIWYVRSSAINSELLYKLKCGNIHKMNQVILTNDSSKLIFQDSIYDEATHIARQNSEIHKWKNTKQTASSHIKGNT